MILRAWSSSSGFSTFWQNNNIFAHVWCVAAPQGMALRTIATADLIDRFAFYVFIPVFTADPVTD